MKPTEKDVLDALRTCKDPELGRDLVSLGMIRAVRIEEGTVSFDLVLTTPACPLKGRMEEEARAAVLRVPGVREVRVRMDAEVQKDARLESVLPPGVRNVVAVGSGKGGVGKSSVSVNLAAALAREGARVGLLDADVYGPNQPQMLGLGGRRPKVDAENRILPLENHGVRLMSMGFLMDDDTPVIWRGPMLHGAVRQFLAEVLWGELDYLLVDLPPGTGDVQLSLCQSAPIVGALVVTTPQSIAVSDVRKAVAMFRKLEVPVLGVVENMSVFACPHCGKASRLFGAGGGKGLSEDFRIPDLGSIPLDPLVCEGGERGVPVVLSHPESAAAAAFRSLARQVAAQVSLQNHNRRAREAAPAAASGGKP
ncbi:MAG: Mrp/NBP35 family ATP-binding protein [Elusimicrobiota bacterium]|jgi:ATP-binding protein involved in chromosome partitioning